MVEPGFIEGDEAMVLNLQVLMQLLASRRRRCRRHLAPFQTHVARNIRLLMATVDTAAPFARIMEASIIPVGDVDGDGDAGAKGIDAFALNRVMLSVSW
jgi:hypothetical protein